MAAAKKSKGSAKKSAAKKGGSKKTAAKKGGAKKSAAKKSGAKNPVERVVSTVTKAAKKAGSTVAGATRTARKVGRRLDQAGDALKTGAAVVESVTDNVEAASKPSRGKKRATR